ncbi:MAG: hypothetical protein ACP5OB_06250 [Candidatus Ratteibacteria bacterium]
MIDTLKIYEDLKKVMGEEGAKALTEVMNRIFQELVEKVTKEEFRELKEAVERLAEAQIRTEERLTRLEEAVERLIEAQRKAEERLARLEEAQIKTEERLARLEEAQIKTEERLNRLEIVVQELAEAQRKGEERIGRLEEAVKDLIETQKKTEIEIAKLTKGMKNLRSDLGGITKTFGYAFENEAYKNLPIVLKNKYNIEMIEKFVRAEIGGKEINIFGKGKINGKEVYIVGETKLRIDERRLREQANIFKEIEEKVKIVKKEYGEVDIVKIIVTHFTTKKFIEKAKERDIIVVQSFEW